MKKRKLWEILSVLLIFGFTLMSCPSNVPADFSAKAPVIQGIEIEPAGAFFYTGNTAIKLTVTANSPDGGVLSYRWYSTNGPENNTDGTAIPENADAQTYRPPAGNAGIFYYYVVVTNTNNNATLSKTATAASEVVSITLVNPDGVEPPNITTQPSFSGDLSDIWEFQLPLPSVALTVAVAAPGDGGTISYQWHRAETNAGAGTEITGADTATYRPTQNGYYYVNVTNYNPSATDTQEVTIPSNRVNIAAKVANITLTVHNATNTWPTNYGFSTATDRYQYIRGVGGASNIEFRAGNGSASPNVSDADLHRLFSPDPIVMSGGDGTGSYVSGGLGMNLLRICFYDDLDGFMNGTIKGSNAFAGGDNSDYFSNIQVVNSHGGYVYATPWTLPAALKATSATGTTGGTLLGNSGQYARTDRFPQIADHFVAYMDKLWANNAPIFGMSLQNESNGDVGYEGTRWSGSNMQVVIRDHIGPKIRAANTQPGRNVPGVGPQGIKGYGGGKEWDQIWFAPGEHMGNTDTSDGAQPTVNDAEARKYIQWVGRHLYSSSGVSPYPTALGHGLEVWQTEITDAGDYISPSYDVITQWRWAWHIPNMIYQTFALNDESAFFWWYFKRFYCIMGDGDRGTTNGALNNRGYVMSHFSKYAADSRRIRVSAAGSYVTNQGSTAASTNDTALPLTSTGNNPNFNPQVFAAWVANSSAGATSGANQPSTKIMAFQFPHDAATPADVESIVIIAFTPTRNAGDRGQDAGNIQINLPDGFAAGSAELMRSSENVKHRMETVTMNEAGTKAVINLPRSNIVSVKFTKAP